VDEPGFEFLIAGSFTKCWNEFLIRTFCPCSRCVRRLFHSLALGAAVFVRRCRARTNGVCTLLGFRGRHFFSPSFGSTAVIQRRHLKHLGEAFQSDKGHISIFGRSVVVRPPRRRRHACGSSLLQLLPCEHHLRGTIAAQKQHSEANGAQLWASEFSGKP
jgi:hypothetical protein